MSEFLKGTFKVKRPVVEDPSSKKIDSDEIKEELREKALASLGGSMVYVERTRLTWDGSDDDKADKRKGGQ